MTGTQSLSFFQLQTIRDEVDRLEIQARRRLDVHETKHGLVYEGQPVSIAISEVDRAHTSEGYRPIPERLPLDTDKRVQINRAYYDSVTFWLNRDGEIVGRFGA